MKAYRKFFSKITSLLLAVTMVIGSIPVTIDTTVANTIPATNTIGYLERADGGHIGGWAKDQTYPGVLKTDPNYAGVKIMIYDNGNPIATNTHYTLLAMANRVDVGDHAFGIDPQTVTNLNTAGEHTITAKAIDVDTLEYVNLPLLPNIKNKFTNAKCGSANGGSFTTKPANLCDFGDAKDDSSSGGQWKWTCNGVNYGRNVSCFANIIVVPVAPINLATSNITQTSLTLSWTDKATNEIGYKIYKNGNSTPIATIGVNSSSYNVTGLTANTTYTFRVAAYNLAGEGSASINATTKSPNGSICTSDSQCGSGNCDIDFDSGIKYCHADAIQCVDYDIGNPWQRANGYELCSGQSWYKSCSSSLWGAQQNNPDPANDYCQAGGGAQSGYDLAATCSSGETGGFTNPSCVSCAPYIAASTSSCKTSCTSSFDCWYGYSCNASNQCVSNTEIRDGITHIEEYPYTEYPSFNNYIDAIDPYDPTNTRYDERYFADVSKENGDDKGNELYLNPAVSENIILYTYMNNSAQFTSATNVKVSLDSFYQNSAGEYVTSPFTNSIDVMHSIEGDNTDPDVVRDPIIVASQAGASLRLKFVRGTGKVQIRGLGTGITDVPTGNQSDLLETGLTVGSSDYPLSGTFLRGDDQFPEDRRVIVLTYLSVERVNADVSITRSATSTNLWKGQETEITLNYNNNGPVETTGVEVVDNYDESILSIISSSLPVGCVDSGSEVTCMIAGELANGAGGSLAYTAEAISSGIAVNTATISSDITDSNAGNNTATQNITVNPGPTVTIENATPLYLTTGNTSTITWSATSATSGPYEVKVGNCTSGTLITGANASGNYVSTDASVASVVNFSDLSEGQNTIYVCVTDGSGALGSETQILTLDTISPENVSNVILQDQDVLIHNGLDGYDVTVTWTPNGINEPNFSTYEIYLLPALTVLDTGTHNPIVNSLTSPTLALQATNIWTGTDTQKTDSAGTILSTGNYKAYVRAVDSANLTSSAISSASALLERDDLLPPEFVSSNTVNNHTLRIIFSEPISAVFPALIIEPTGLDIDTTYNSGGYTNGYLINGTTVDFRVNKQGTVNPLNDDYTANDLGFNNCAVRDITGKQKANCSGGTTDGIAQISNLTVTDGIAPTLTLTKPSTGVTTDLANFEVDYTFSETIGDGTIVMTFTQTGGPVDSNSPHSVTITDIIDGVNAESVGRHQFRLDSSDLNNDGGGTDSLVDGGIYTVKLEASDLESNQSNISNTNWKWILDITPPAFTVLADILPEYTNNPAPQFTWTTVIDPSPVTYRVELSLSSDFSTGAFMTEETSDTQWTLDPSFLSDGSYDNTYYVRVITIDIAENESAPSNTESFTLDTQVPEILDPTLTDTTISSTEYTKNGDTITLTATINDVNRDAMDITMITANLSDFGGGSSVNPFSYIGGTGVATWAIPPSITCTDGTINVPIDATDTTGNVAVQVNATITCDNTPPAFTGDFLTSPNGRESLAGGSFQTITWNSANLTEINFKEIIIKYSDDEVSGDNVWVISSGEVNDGTYTWTVPTINTSQAKVILTVIDQVGNTISDESTTFFTIDSVAPTIETDTLITPNGGEYISGGSSYNITWNTSAITDSNLRANPITLEYFNGTTLSWSEIANPLPNTSPYQWHPVPSLNITNAKVRITAYDESGNSSSDESDSYFTIDSTKPTISSITYLDIDVDGISGERGEIDRVVIVFNEEISSIGINNGVGFTFAGHTITLNSGVLSTTNITNDTLTFTINETGVDTVNMPDATYNSSLGTIQDLAGNLLANIASGDITETDGVSPIILSAETGDTIPTVYNGNGQIDNYKVTFSETIDFSNLTANNSNDFSIASYSNLKICVDAQGTDCNPSDNADSDTFYVVFDESGVPDTGEIPELTYDSTNSRVQDSSNANTMQNILDVDLTEEDKALPVLYTAIYMPTGTITNNKLILSFSENINDTNSSVNLANLTIVGTGSLGTPNFNTVTANDSVYEIISGADGRPFAIDVDTIAVTLDAIEDSVGNKNVSITPIVISGGIIINELAWSGSGSDSTDEWIELRNLSGNTRDFNNNNYCLYVGSNKLLDLTGTVGGVGAVGQNEFYLISSYTEDLSMISSGASIDITPTTWQSLSDSALEVSLYFSADDTCDNTDILLDKAGNGTAPFAGTDSPVASMERIDSIGVGTDPSSWYTAVADTTYIMSPSFFDSANQKGTPDSENIDDVTAPEFTPNSASPVEDSIRPDRRPLLSIEYSDNFEVVSATMMIDSNQDGVCETLVVSDSLPSTSLSKAPTNDLSFGRNKLCVTLEDAQGNESVKDWYFWIDNFSFSVTEENAVNMSIQPTIPEESNIHSTKIEVQTYGAGIDITAFTNLFAISQWNTLDETGFGWRISEASDLTTTNYALMSIDSNTPTLVKSLPLNPSGTDLKTYTYYIQYKINAKMSVPAGVYTTTPNFGINLTY